LYVLTFVKACDAWVIRKGRWLRPRTK
jgi:hypothetical protein